MDRKINLQTDSIKHKFPFPSQILNKCKGSLWEFQMAAWAEYNY